MSGGVVLRTRFAAAEEGSRVSQVALNIRCERMRATQSAPRDRCRVLEHRHCFAEIAERGAVGRGP